jgi:hypothetical protein
VRSGFKWAQREHDAVRAAVATVTVVASFAAAIWLIAGGSPIAGVLALALVVALLIAFRLAR